MLTPVSICISIILGNKYKVSFNKTMSLSLVKSPSLFSLFEENKT